MRERSFRRHQTQRHMWRRLKEDRNQHYNNLTCACWTDQKVMAKFKEQPKHCSCYMCGNQRRVFGRMERTMQERRVYQETINVNSEAEHNSGGV